MHTSTLSSIETAVIRHGVVLEPNGDHTEAEGAFNPACARTRDGKLLLYPRLVGKGNTSRIGILEAHGSSESPVFTRIGYALEPQEPYELRSKPGGYGCEDPRITFIGALDMYVMAYVAFGPKGTRIGVAVSHDAYTWKRLGLIAFAPGLSKGSDKDAAFFPEPVLSPSGVLSFALYHRPMLRIPVKGQLALPLPDRECTRIGYIPLEPVLHDHRKLLEVTESACVLEPAGGELKTGGGTPPMQIGEGWFSIYHTVDAIVQKGARFKVKYNYHAGLIVHDLKSPHIVRYRSSQAILSPETPEELGAQKNVVFPTAIDAREDITARTYDVYYGMADARIGRMRLRVGTSIAAQQSESAAA